MSTDQHDPDASTHDRDRDHPHDGAERPGEPDEDPRTARLERIWDDLEDIARRVDAAAAPGDGTGDRTSDERPGAASS